MTHGKLTAAEQRYINHLVEAAGGRRKFGVKQCYRSAQLLILFDDEKRLRYWECGLPRPHAWVTINGKIVDLTHEANTRLYRRRGYGEMGERDYSGAYMVNRREVHRAMRRGFPLFSRPHRTLLKTVPA